MCVVALYQLNKLLCIKKESGVGKIKINKSRWSLNKYINFSLICIWMKIINRKKNK